MKQVGTDFQGWPVVAKTLKEVLLELGLEVKETSNDECFVSGYFTKKILDAYPLVLKDDGMACGVDPMYITEINTDVYTDKETNESVFNVFIDPEVK